MVFRFRFSLNVGAFQVDKHIDKKDINFNRSNVLCLLQQNVNETPTQSLKEAKRKESSESPDME